MKAEPQQEHEWLHQCVGNWDVAFDCPTGPGQPAMESKGSEVVRSLGGIWIVAESQSEMPGGGTTQMLMNLGFDTQIKRFVGIFIGSMMSNLWSYNGTLDLEKNLLTLDTEGPVWGENKTAKYQDSIQIINSDHRILRSQMQREDGTWVPVMEARYHRRK